MKSMKLWQKILMILCVLGLLCSLMLFVPFVQNLLLDFGENFVVHRPLTRPIWIERFVNWGIKFFILFVLFSLITILLPLLYLKNRYVKFYFNEIYNMVKLKKTSEVLLVYKKNYKKIFIFCLGIFLFAFVLKIFYSDIDRFSNVFYISLVPVILAIMLLPQCQLIKTIYKTSILFKIICLCLSVLFIAMISFSDLLLSEKFINFSLAKKILFLIVVFLCILYDSAILLFKASNHNCNVNSEEELKNTFYLCTSLIILISTLCVVTTNTGVWIEADASLYNSFPSHSIGDWHTVGYWLFAFIFYSITSSVFGVIVANGVLCIIVNLVAVNLLKVIMKSKNAMLAYTIVSILVFSPYYYIQVMYKDPPFSFAIFGFSLFIIYAINSEEITFPYFLFGVITLLLSMKLRHGGSIPVILSLFVLLLYLFKTNAKTKIVRVSFVFCVAICFSVLINFIAFDLMRAEKNPKYVKYGTPLYMISAACNEGIEFRDKDIQLLEEVASVEEWSSFYNKYWVDDASRSWGKVGEERINKIAKLVDEDNFGRNLIGINFYLVTHHPVFYISHLLDPSSILWEIAEPTDGYNWALVNTSINKEIKYKGAYKLIHAYGKFTFDFPIMNSISWRGGFSIFILFFSLAIFILKRKYAQLIFLIPIFIWDALMLILTPSQDPRYVLPSIMTSIFAIIFSNFMIRENYIIENE